MKIVRFGARGKERPGLVDDEGKVRDLSGLIPDWTPRYLRPAALTEIAAFRLGELPVIDGAVRLGIPIEGVGKFIGIGLNFTDFAAEAQRPIPKEPAMFMKAISSLTGPSDPVMLPKDSVKTDWEVELGVIIGTTARYVASSEALNFVAGYCLVNDISEREFQNDRGGTWDKGKGCDTFGPLGPWIVTPDELGDPQDVDLWLEVNGKRHQEGNTRNMIFPVAELIAHVSMFLTLHPGDILTTGTPAGVGFALRPNPVFLKAGDLMRLGSSKLGTQKHFVESWRGG